MRSNCIPSTSQHMGPPSQYFRRTRLLSARLEKSRGAGGKGDGVQHGLKFVQFFMLREPAKSAPPRRGIWRFSRLCAQQATSHGCVWAGSKKWRSKKGPAPGGSKNRRLLPRDLRDSANLHDDPGACQASISPVEAAKFLTVACRRAALRVWVLFGSRAQRSLNRV